MMRASTVNSLMTMVLIVLVAACKKDRFHKEVGFFIQSIEEDEQCVLFLDDHHIGRLENSDTLVLPCDTETWDKVLWSTLDRKKTPFHISCKKRGKIIEGTIISDRDGTGGGYIAKPDDNTTISWAHSPDYKTFFIGINTGLRILEYGSLCDE